MKKSKFLIITLFISSLCFKQKIIINKGFDKLMDYPNCKYIQAFIEKNDASKPYFENYYLEKVKLELVKIDLGSFQKIPKYERIKELLSNNTLTLRLAKKNNERKLQYDEFQVNESLLHSLIISGWDNIDFNKTVTNIQNKILAKYSSVQGKNNIKFFENYFFLAKTMQKAPKDEESQLKSLKIHLYCGLGVLLLLVFAIVVFLIILTSRKNIIKHVLNSQRVAEKFNLYSNGYFEPYKLTEADINLIVDRVLECKRLNEIENQKKYIESKNKKVESTKVSYKYLKGKTGKIFSRAENSSENSFFRLFDEHDDYALFEFNGDEVEAIANRIFSDDICNIIYGGYQNAQRVITDKPGKVKRIDDQWEVIELIQIKLI